MRKGSNLAKNNIFVSFPRFWPIIWGIIYGLIIIVGVISPTNDFLTFIKLGGIFLCLFYVVQYFHKDYLLQLALLFTSIADIVLALENTAISGIITFLIAQIIHLFRLSDKSNHLSITIFAIFAIIASTCDAIWGFAPLIFVVCAFYLAVLIANIGFSWRWLKSAPKARAPLFSLLGFILFLCCDTCTAVSYLSLTGVFPAFLYGLANFFAWAFYYPSQILISNSSKCAKIIPKGR